MQILKEKEKVSFQVKYFVEDLQHAYGRRRFAVKNIASKYLGDDLSNNSSISVLTRDPTSSNKLAPLFELELVRKVRRAFPPKLTLLTNL